jgi:hypothetical protein
MDTELQPLIKSLSFGDIDEPASRMKVFQWNMDHRQIERGVFEGVESVVLCNVYVV